MTTLTHAETARLAHKALRLREAGVDSEKNLRALAAKAPAGRILGLSDPERDQTIVQGTAAAHAELALAVVCHLQDDLPGPTVPDTARKLMARTLTDIHREWDDAVTANLEATMKPGDLKAWRASVKRDAKAAAELHAEMAETGAEFPVHPAFGHMRHTDGAANALYDLGRQGILDDTIAMSVATIKLVLIDSADYAVNLATHQFLSSVAAIGRVATTAALASKTFAAGVFDAADLGFGNVTGDPSEAIAVVQTSAAAGGADVADTAQRLVGYMDTATGLPVSPNGGAINVVFDNGANRIFKL